MKHIRICLSIILFIFCCHTLSCREIPRFSILTCGPGKEIYQLEGHTGLRIQLGDGIDMVANWGIFDFNTPNFAYRYTKGETDYMMAVGPTDFFLNIYKREGREVMEQKLQLPDSVALVLLQLLEENSLPQNRVYRYNYVKDNCATRPLALIEKALGDTVIFHETGRFLSYRDAMAYYHAGYPWYQFGIDLALGSGIDKPLTIRDEAFAPVRLAALLQSATYNNGTPLVSDTSVLLTAAGSDVETTLITPMAVCWTICVITLLLCRRAVIRRRIPRLWTAILFTVTGIAGLVLAFLIFISTHEATSPNWLFLTINPLLLIIALLQYIKPAEKLAVWLQIINFVLSIILLIAAISGIQVLNPAVYPLVISVLMCSATTIYIFRWQKKQIC